MPVIEVCNGYIFGAAGGVLSHQINKNISLLRVGQYEGLKYVIKCELYKTVYETEQFSGQAVAGLVTPSPTILNNPKLISMSLNLSKDTFPTVNWNYQSFPLSGDCGSFNLPELDPSIVFADCSFSVDGVASGISGIESVSFTESLALITKEVGSGGLGETVDDPIAKFGFVVAKQINKKMNITSSKDPDPISDPISVTAQSADGGTSCHISQARINGTGRTYATDNFARFDINLSVEEPYIG